MLRRLAGLLVPLLFFVFSQGCAGVPVKEKLAQARTQVFVLQTDLTGIPVQTWDLQGHKVKMVTDAKAGWYLIPNWRVFLKILMSGEMPD